MWIPWVEDHGYKRKHTMTIKGKQWPRMGGTWGRNGISKTTPASLSGFLLNNSLFELVFVSKRRIMCIISCTSGDPHDWGLSLTPLQRWGSWGLARSENMRAGSQLLSTGARSELGFPHLATLMLIFFPFFNPNHIIREHEWIYYRGVP